MRLPTRDGPSPDSESENEFPETKLPEEYSDDEDNSAIFSSPVSKIQFRSLRRGTCIDIKDDDGNWYAAEIMKLDNREKKIFVSFKNSGDLWDRWIVFDNRVALLHTKTYDNNGNFKVGQIVEFAVGIGTWKKGTITAISPEHNRVQVTVDDADVDYESHWVVRPRHNIRAVQRSQYAARSRRRWKVPVPATTLDWRTDGSGIGSGSSHDENDNSLVYDKENQAIPDSAQYQSSAHVRKIAEFSDRYTQYINALQMNSLTVIPVNGDGNCLFRAVAHQVYGNEELHSLVRDLCMTYMEADSAFFSQFVEGGQEAFAQYVAAKRTSGCWGDDPEIQAICEIYDRPAEIWAYDPQCGARKLRTFHEAAISGSGANFRAPTPAAAQSDVTIAPPPFIKLSYYGGGHYDSLVDPRHSRNLLRTEPGVVERAAIGRCGQRRLQQQHPFSVGTSSRSSGSNGSDYLPGRQLLEDVKQRTDAEATERDALDLAIQISRHEHLGWASEDLDACLLLALDSSQQTSTNANISGYSSSTSTFATTNNSNISAAHSLSLQALSGEALHDATNDLVAVQQDLLHTVAEQSDREFVDSAILASMATATATANNDAITAQAYEIIEEDSKRTDDEILEQARLASLQEYSQHAFKHDCTSEGYVYDSGDMDQHVYPIDDPELAEALKLSELSEDEVLALAMENSLTDRRAVPATTTYRDGNQWRSEDSKGLPSAEAAYASNVKVNTTQSATTKSPPTASTSTALAIPSASTSQDQVQGHFKESGGTASAAVLKDEEAMLQAAIRESLKDSTSYRSSPPLRHANAVSSGSGSTQSTSGARAAVGQGHGAAWPSTYYEVGDEDEELNRAIANSLKELQ